MWRNLCPCACTDTVPYWYYTVLYWLDVYSRQPINARTRDFWFTPPQGQSSLSNFSPGPVGLPCPLRFLIKMSNWSVKLTKIFVTVLYKLYNDFLLDKLMQSNLELPDIYLREGLRYFLCVQCCQLILTWAGVWWMIEWEAHTCPRHTMPMIPYTCPRSGRLAWSSKWRY